MPYPLFLHSAFAVRGMHADFHFCFYFFVRRIATWRLDLPEVQLLELEAKEGVPDVFALYVCFFFFGIGLDLGVD